MAAPERPLRLCLLVDYPSGLASPSGSPPRIAVYALVDPSDENDPGIKMRVERCTGAGCSDFAFRGNSNGLDFTSPTPTQTEFIDTAAYGTIYRYRIQMENDDGVSAYSEEVEIDTTINGTGACSGGTDPGPDDNGNGASRRFNGGTDYLSDGRPASTITGNKNTFAVWVTRDSNGPTRNALCGRLWDENSGWAFLADENNRLGLYVGSAGTNEFCSIPSPDLSERSFIAIVRDFTLAAVDERVKLYYGRSSGEITLIGTASETVGIGQLGNFGLLVGNASFGNSISVSAWNGKMDQVGLWNDALMLEEIKAASTCGSRVRMDAAVLIADITGENPEPFLSFGTPYTMAVNGTTVEPGLCGPPLTAEIQEMGLMGFAEYTLSEIQELGLMGFVEYWAQPSDRPTTPPGDTEPGGAGPDTGPDPDRFTGPNPPPYVDGSGNKNIFIYYGHTWEFSKDPLDVTRHDSFELDFGWAHWKFVRRLLIAGVSSQPITLEIWVDEVFRFTTTLTLATSSGTGWERTVIEIPPNCVKGQLFRFIMRSSAPFKIFMDQSTVEWHPLSGEEGYRETPFALASAHER